MANALIRKTGIYFIGNLASKVTSALIIPIYAYFVSSEALGLFDYSQTIMTIASPLIFLAVWESVIRFILGEDSPSERLQKVANVIFVTIAALLFLLVVGIILCAFFSQHLEFVVSALLLIAFFGVAQVWQYLARSFAKSNLYALSGILGALTNFAGIVLFVCVLKMQFFGLIISYLLGQLVIILIIETRLHLLSFVKIKAIKSSTIKLLLSFSVPLAMNSAFLALMLGIGRLLITNFLGPSENGIYAFAMKFGTIITAFGSIFAMAAIEESILRIGQPSLHRFFETLGDATAKLLLSLFIIALPIVQLFYLLINDATYSSSANLVPAFLLYGIFAVLSTVLGNVFQVTNTTKKGMLTSFIGTIVTIAFSLLFIGPFGIQGVAWALSLGSLSILIIRYLWGIKLVRYKLNFRAIIVFCILAGISLLCYLTIPSFDNPYLLACWTILSALIAIPTILKNAKVLNSIPDSESAPHE